MNLMHEDPLTITPVNCDIPTMDVLCYVEIAGYSTPDIALSSSTPELWQGVWALLFTLSLCFLLDAFKGRFS